MRRDQRIIDVAGMAGRIAQAHDAIDFGQPMQQPAKRPSQPVRADRSGPETPMLAPYT